MQTANAKHRRQTEMSIIFVHIEMDGMFEKSKLTDIYHMWISTGNAYAVRRCN